MIEAGWEHTYPGQDLAVELLGPPRRGWRWFRVRLFGLLSRDTATATLWGQQTPAGASPQAVGDTLAAWAK